MLLHKKIKEHMALKMKIILRPVMNNPLWQPSISWLVSSFGISVLCSTWACTYESSVSSKPLANWISFTATVVALVQLGSGQLRKQGTGDNERKLALPGHKKNCHRGETMYYFYRQKKRLCWNGYKETSLMCPGFKPCFHMKNNHIKR